MPVEGRLVLMLCRYPVDRIDLAEAANLCSQIADAPLAGTDAGGWGFFLRLAAHHRVLPLVSANARLVNLPPAVIQQLHAYASRNAIEAFRSLTETQRLLRALDSVEIHATVLKGVALSLQAYGDVATRDVGDIDLLIQPEQTSEADALLQQNGYVRKDPRGRLTPRRRASYARHFKDYTYEPLAMEAQGGFEVDLHWRLFRSQLMPGNELIQVETVSIPAGSLEITTLSHPAHLLYLAIQGALDGWTRFKSVADIAALWNGCEKADVLELAREAAVLPYLFAALALAEDWIGGIDLPEDFRMEKVLQHPLTGRIVEHAKRTMCDAAFFQAARDASSWDMKRYEASLYGSRAYKQGIVSRVLLRPRVWERFDLPDTLFPLYPLLSPVEWLLFHLGSKGGKQS